MSNTPEPSRLAIVSTSKEQAQDEAMRKFASYTYMFSSKIHGNPKEREYIFYKDQI